MQTKTEIEKDLQGLAVRDDVAVIYYGQVASSERNVILLFEFIERFHSGNHKSLDRTTIDETDYIQKEIRREFGIETLDQGSYYKKDLNDFIAETYLNMMI